MMGNQQTKAADDGTRVKGQQQKQQEKATGVSIATVSLDPDEHCDRTVSQSATLSVTPAMTPSPATKESSLLRSFASVRDGATKYAIKGGVKDGVMITDALSDVRIKYHINQKEIGHGHYGVVRKCMHRQTKEWYAIKSIRKSKMARIEPLRREVEVLKELDHPNIIKLVDIHEDNIYLHLTTER
jgi:hypothetical protein